MVSKMLELKIDKLNFPLFKEALKRLKEINESDLLMKVIGTEIQLGAYSKSKAEAAVVRISPLFFGEDGFKNDKPEEAQVFSIDPRITDRVVTRFKECTIRFDGKLTFGHGKRKFIIPTMYPETDFPEGLINLSYEHVINVPNVWVAEAIKDMQVDNFTSYSSVSFVLDEKKLTLSRSTDFVETSENTIEVDSEGEAQVSVALDGLGKIVTGLARRAENTRFEVEDEKPVVIKYIFPEGIQMYFAISPHQDTDEYDPDAVDEDDEDYSYDDDDEDDEEEDDD